MEKDGLKKRTSRRRLFQIQLMECIFVFLLLQQSYGLAGKFVCCFVFPLSVPGNPLIHAAISMLAILLLSHFQFFRRFGQPCTETVKKVFFVGFLCNGALIVLLYFITSVRWPACYFIVASLLQIALLLLLKYASNRLKRKIIGDSLHLFLVAGEGEPEFVKDFCKQCREKATVVSASDEDLEHYLTRADHIYLMDVSTAEAKRNLLSCCSLEDKRVYLVPGIFEIAVRNAAFACMGDTPVFALESFHLTEAEAAVKRLTDIVLSLLGIVITLPMILFVILCIKLGDGGPAFYTQERSGLRGKPFNMIKFRSMVVDAEKETGAVLAKENDHRITKIGRFIRASRIDEIPQFFNILAGNMSFVGPRPERPVFVEEYSRKIPGYRYRMQVKPGLTGLAQVKGQYTTSAENKIKFDLMYLMNYSLWLDLKIIAWTVKVVLKGGQAKGFDEYECYDDCSLL